MCLSVLSTAGVSASNVTTAETPDSSSNTSHSQNSTEYRTPPRNTAAGVTTPRHSPITSRPYVPVNPRAPTTTRYFHTTSRIIPGARPVQNGTTRTLPGFISPRVAPARTTTLYWNFQTTTRPPYFPRSTTTYWRRRQQTTTNRMTPHTTRRSADANTTAPTGAVSYRSPTPSGTVQPAQPAELSTAVRFSSPRRQGLTTGTRPPWYFTSRPRPGQSTTAWVLTSAPSYTERGEVVHCHVQLANNYQRMLNISGHERDFYARELLPRIALLCGVDDIRISDVNVFENPQTGATFIN